MLGGVRQGQLQSISTSVSPTFIWMCIVIPTYPSTAPYVVGWVFTAVKQHHDVCTAPLLQCDPRRRFRGNPSQASLTLGPSRVTKVRARQQERSRMSAWEAGRGTRLVPHPPTRPGAHRGIWEGSVKVALVSARRPSCHATSNQKPFNCHGPQRIRELQEPGV
jgi:hypothetical protein